MKGSHLSWLSRSKGMTVDIWIRDYPSRCFQKKISGRGKHNAQHLRNALIAYLVDIEYNKPHLLCKPNIFARGGQNTIFKVLRTQISTKYKRDILLAKICKQKLRYQIGQTTITSTCGL
jgi:hypothetical protein